MNVNNAELIQTLVIQIQQSEGVEKRLLLDKLAPELDAFIWSILRTHGAKQIPQDSFQTAWVGVMKAIETYDASKYETGQGTWSLSSLDKVISDTDNVMLLEKLKSSDNTSRDFMLKNLEENARQLIENNYTGTKRLILLKYLDGTRPVDIAAELGVSRSHVSNTVSKFKQKCREQLT